jgi:hypothetical protein
VTDTEAEPAPADDAPSATSVVPTLSALLGLVPGPSTARCRYLVAGGAATEPGLQQAAELLAEDAVAHRCGRAKAANAWRSRRHGGLPHPAKLRAALEAFLADTFGLPAEDGTAPPPASDLLQGYVAELAWHRLAREHTVPAHGRRLVHVADLSWSPYQQGGDGLVVYAITDGRLTFQLWETKKHDAAETAVSGTISRACRQLSSEGKRYLAQYTAYGSKLEGELGSLYADLVQLWVDRDPRAGVGVSVATSTRHAPGGIVFDSVVTTFPDHGTPGQREGLAVVVPDFPRFAAMVRDVVWTGL